ncbi:nicotine blue oxidoreductase [Arthrobacter nitrophenolicus]|uniref:Nicotine blue oxidoreductase n=2 Tax=Arthrobacter nitrophenolicus TaxID=683150 RepID=A0ACC6TGX1_9MICC|nr:nucleotidyltransferase family protein [Arthrobacter nitrophenolicus]ELT44861.1 molybdenum cofactor cytidylyltransferase [Arthrobacter nitrophenolicus]
MENTDLVQVTGVLLAAGAGTRLGRGPKALLPYRGRPLVEIIADNLLAGGCHEVVVVLGAEAQAVSAGANLKPYRTLVNHKWPSGMGSSYLIGDAAANADDHILVALVDQPGLTVRTVSRLLVSHRPGRITSAAYAAPDNLGMLRRGHPMLIDVRLRPAVASTVVGDAGARSFLRQKPWLVDLIDCSDESTGEDVDTVEQMRRLL